MSSTSAAIVDFAGLLTTAAEDGEDVVVDLGTDSLTLQGVELAELTTEQFTF